MNFVKLQKNTSKPTIKSIIIGFLKLGGARFIIINFHYLLTFTTMSEQNKFREKIRKLISTNEIQSKRPRIETTASSSNTATSDENSGSNNIVHRDDEIKGICK